MDRNAPLDVVVRNAQGMSEPSCSECGDLLVCRPSLRRGRFRRGIRLRLLQHEGEHRRSQVLDELGIGDAVARLRSTASTEMASAPSAARTRAESCSSRCTLSSIMPWISISASVEIAGGKARRALSIAVGILFRRSHVALGVNSVVVAPVRHRPARDSHHEALAVRQAHNSS